MKYERLLWVLLVLLAFPLGYLIADSRKPPSLEVAFSPEEPIDTKLLALINNAKKSIWVTQYDFKYFVLADALIAAHKRGVDVRLLTQAYKDELLSEKDIKKRPYKMLNRLDRGGVAVRAVERINGEKLNMHNKYMIIDGETVQMGSLNFSWQALYSNMETVLIIRQNPEVVSQFIAHYSSLWDKSRKY